MCEKWLSALMVLLERYKNCPHPKKTILWVAGFWIAIDFDGVSQGCGTINAH